MKKKCYKCKTLFDISNFYRDKSKKDRYSDRCKNCQRVHNKEKRERNRNTFKEKDFRYYQKHKKEISAKRKIWYQKNQEKVIAHEKVKRALFKGDLVRKSNCEKCNSILHIRAHHDDYSKPLEVRWLCEKCHMTHHHGK